eukprot:Platyproteum_vivax@DN5102_c0_g1_i1.p1
MKNAGRRVSANSTIEAEHDEIIDEGMRPLDAMKQLRAEMQQELEKMESRISAAENRYFQHRAQKNIVEGWDTTNPAGGRRITPAPGSPVVTTTRVPPAYAPTNKLFSYSSNTARVKSP